MGVAIKAKFAKGKRKFNGLDSIEEILIERPHEEHYVIARVRNARTAIDHEHGGVQTPTVNFEHIEVMLSDAEVKDAKKLFENACRHRLGVNPIPEPEPEPTLFDKDAEPSLEG